eukprot:comp22094_c0_seq1/m.51290 comp22094_c0_seq1/g.51290  ORF comp22094_c0_seq1/g.51290 comp22094_c0_seq1/m.51290 type:complete len:435 (-) comp22094_c0_seq1:846-2150(-)
MPTKMDWIFFDFDESDKPTPRNRNNTKSNRNKPFVPFQRTGVCERPTDLNNESLESRGAKHDPKEDPVGRKPMENPRAVVVQLVGGDLVENLKKHKGVEDDGVVARRALGTWIALGPVETIGEVFAVWDVKQLVTNKEKSQQNDELQHGAANHVAQHDLVDQCIKAPIGLAIQNCLGGTLGAQRKCGKGVHDEIDPQHLHGCQRSVVGGASANKHKQQRNQVDGELELEELAHTVVHGAAPHHGLDNRRKVVVQNDDIGRILGNLGASNAHRQPNIGLGQRCGIVGAVARDGNHITALDQRLDQNKLVRWRRACNHLQARQNGAALLVGHCAELGALDHNAIGQDAALARNRLGRADIVARDHAHKDACLFAFFHSLGDPRAQRILDADDGKQRDILRRKILVCLKIRGLGIDKVVLCNKHGAQSGVSHGFNRF